MDTEIRTAHQLRTFAVALLERVGMAPSDAAVVADGLTWADLRGIAAQGVAKLPLIVARLRAGGTNARPRVAETSRTPTAVVFDADDEWGHVSGARAMRAAIERAKQSGVGLAVVRNTSSASAMGYYAMLAVDEGLVGMALNSGAPLLRPWGGTETLLGNQAFAIGAPAGGHPPLLFDSATSAITLTAIDALRARGEPLPEGVALDARGEPTTDPVAALAGIMLPVGGHRGYALTVLFEVLTGVLAGGPRFARDVPALPDFDQPQSVSHFMLAIDPARWMPLDQYVRRMDHLIDRIHACPPAPHVDRVRVPGERGALLAAQREQAGVPLPAPCIAELRRLGAELGVPW